MSCAVFPTIGSSVLFSLLCFFFSFFLFYFFFQAEDGIRDLVRSRGLGDVYKRQELTLLTRSWFPILLVPVFGGVFSLVLYCLFLSGIVSGSLFPVLSLIHI